MEVHINPMYGHVSKIRVKVSRICTTLAMWPGILNPGEKNEARSVLGQAVNLPGTKCVGSETPASN